VDEMVAPARDKLNIGGYASRLKAGTTENNGALRGKLSPCDGSRLIFASGAR
jgi:hypothetical protein